MADLFPIATLPVHAHRCFRAMGNTANITITSATADWGGADPVQLLDAAQQRLRDLESRWSRFLPDSDITRANQAAGSPVSVHADTVAVVLRSIEAWKQTRGLFDVTVLPALLHHGYTHSQAAGATAGTLAPQITAQLIGVSGSISVDRTRSTLTVPAGAAIDLGGIGKGYAADLVSIDLINAGATGTMVEIGGDLVVRGTPAVGERWVVGVQDPTDPPRLIASVALVFGGVATSGTTVRRWRSPAGETVHHLIDPSTAMPSTTSLLTATVVASDVATAEAFATAAMMHDGPQAVELIEGVGLAGLFVTRDGGVLRTRSLRAFSP
ncbi:MAG: thiamine biosynthesis lipoprotein ApbE [Ilumatobacteraceae bacterium]|nr:thiamine biosynthesis lipoprotein ApbE [Ilumatobacteraceae bacterium]